MENVNARRGFLKGFGLLSAVAAGVATSHLANTSTSTTVRNPDDPVLVPPVDQALAPLGKVNLQLTADNRPPQPEVPSAFAIGGHSTVLAINTHGGSYSSPEHNNNVKLSVGKDNRLWAEVDGQWRRIALEA